MMLWVILILSVGLVLLWKGADLLVGGAVGLAERLGVNPLTVGLTIVAMGTSAPEVAASIVAAIGGKGDVAIGNVFGSNIANLALVAGVASLIRPLEVQLRTLCREVPAMLIVALLLLPFLMDMTVGRFDGAVLCVVFGGLVVYTVHNARMLGVKKPIDELHAVVQPAGALRRDVLFIVLGLAGLGAGARMAVYSAVEIGTRVGLSDAVIGSTILAVGTSLPELVTSVVAAVKGHHDISVGNLIGSNIFNTLLVTGVAGLVCPFVVSPRFAGGGDYWIMIAVSAVFAVAAIVGRQAIRRIGGIVLLSVYVGYLIYLLSFTPTA